MNVNSGSLRIISGRNRTGAEKSKPALKRRALGRTVVTPDSFRVFERTVLMTHRITCRTSWYNEASRLRLAFSVATSFKTHAINAQLGRCGGLVGTAVPSSLLFPDLPLHLL